jgi:hypothetical protein
MRECYRDEMPSWLRLLGAWRINRESIDFKWGYFAPRAGLELVLNRGTYFDQRYAINFCLGWGKFMFYLPFKTKLEEGCDMPRYGFAVHNDTFWIYKGGDYQDGQCQNQWLSWYLPFFSYEFDGHWIYGREGWAKMGRNRLGENDGPEPYEYRKSGKAFSYQYPYTYTLKNGTVQERTATCTIERRKWHRKWFPFLTKESTVIDIEFNDEVGERSGSWKGGTIGCSYELLPDETVYDCLKRMERERKM